MLMGITTDVLIARMLGPQGRGAYALAILVPGFLVLIASLGIGVSNTYFCGSKKYSVDDLASSSVISSLALGILFTLAFWAYFFISHPSFLKDVDPSALIITTIVLPFNLLMSYFSYILLGQDRIKEYNLITLVRGGALLFFIIMFVWQGKGGLIGATMAWAGAVIVAAIFSILRVRKSAILKWTFNLPLFTDTVKFGVKAQLGSVIAFFYFRLNIFLIAIFLNVTFVGYYSIAIGLAERLLFLPGIVGTLIFASTSALSTEDANRLTPKICRNTLFLTFLFAAIFFAVSKYAILLLYGVDFFPAVQPLWILLPGAIALSLDKVLGNEITGRGKPIVGTIIAAISLVINIPLNLLLIPRMGIIGAALATSISYSATAVMTFIVFIKISKVSWVDVILVKREDLRSYAIIVSKSKRWLSSKVGSTA